VPESSNPYQFVYNNPLVYRDPTGEISLAELNATMNVQQVLQNIRQLSTKAGLDYAKDKAGEFIGNVVMRFLGTVVPGDPTLTKSLDNIINNQRGRQFERFLFNGLCHFMKDVQSQWLDKLWIEVPITTRGRPVGNGFHCGALPGTPEGDNNLERIRRVPIPGDPVRPFQRFNSPNVDFLIKNRPPVERIPKSWLIGDFKISLNDLHKAYVIGSRRRQWQAITSFAKNRRRSHAPLGFFIVGKNGPQTQKAELEAKALAKGIVMAILPIRP
jgi:hypothetical protein